MLNLHNFFMQTLMISFFQKDINSILEVNEECVHLFGIKKSKNVAGISDYEIACKLTECAAAFQKQDKQVILSNKPLGMMAIHVCERNERKILLTTKSSFRNKEKIIGTFWCSIDVTRVLSEIYYLFSKITNYTIRHTYAA